MTSRLAVQRWQGFPWLADDVSPDEFGVLSTLKELASKDLELARMAAGLPWLTDDVGNDERQALDSLASISSKYLELARAMMSLPWVADGVTSVEHRVLHSLASVAFNDLELARMIVRLPQARETAVVMYSLARIARRDPDAYTQLTEQPWFADGLDDEETALLAPLWGTTVSNARNLFTDLLEVHYTRSKSVSLPLAGEANIWVFQDVPFPRGEDLPSIIHDSARIMEEFLGTPFPTADIILLILNQRPEVNPGHFGNHMRLNRGNDDSVPFIPHETAHYYFIFAPVWFREGTAQLLEAYINDLKGVQDLADRRSALSERVKAVCLDSEWKIENISHHTLLVEQLRASELTQYIGGLSWPGECSHYLVGENFLLQVFNTIGQEGVSSALRELYMLWESGQHITEEDIYQAFLKNVPTGLEDEFLDLYRRLHGGTFVVP